MANPILRLFATLCVLCACVVVVLGAYTRLVDAGLGCPDWPGCYGFLSVPESAEEVAQAQARFPGELVEADKAWPEMVHRYFATGLGLLILIMTWISFTGRHQGAPVKLCLGLLALVILQGAFGAWTVTLKLWPQVVTAHLLGGFATLSLLWLLCLRVGQFGPWYLLSITAIVPSRGAAVWRSLRPIALLALILLVIQIALGGWVSSNYAALACADFPTCHGQWLPAVDWVQGFNIAQTVGPNYLGGLMDSEARVAIQVSHRIGALIVFIVISGLAWRLFQAGSKLAWWVSGALLLQVALGILNVVLVLPLIVATAHNGVAALLLLSVVSVNYAVRKTGTQST